MMQAEIIVAGGAMENARQKWQGKSD